MTFRLPRLATIKSLMKDSIMESAINISPFFFAIDSAALKGSLPFRILNTLFLIKETYSTSLSIRPPIAPEVSIRISGSILLSELSSAIG